MRALIDGRMGAKADVSLVDADGPSHPNLRLTLRCGGVLHCHCQPAPAHTGRSARARLLCGPHSALLAGHGALHYLLLSGDDAIAAAGAGETTGPESGPERGRGRGRGLDDDGPPGSWLIGFLIGQTTVSMPPDDEAHAPDKLQAASAAVELRTQYMQNIHGVAESGNVNQAQRFIAEARPPPPPPRRAQPCARDTPASAARDSIGMGALRRASEATALHNRRASAVHSSSTPSSLAASRRSTWRRFTAGRVSWRCC